MVEFSFVEACQSVSRRVRAIVCGAFEGTVSSTMLTVTSSKEAMAHTMLSGADVLRMFAALMLSSARTSASDGGGRGSLTPSLSYVCTTDVY